MCAKDVRKSQKPEVGTTGHVWDGIEELNNPLPRWWVWVFYATIAWGIWYTIAYPAWPLLNRATEGYLGQDTRADVAAEIARFEEANAGISAALAAAPLAAIKGDGQLEPYAQAAGAAVFRTNCATCHGAGAAAGGAEGNGYANLVDNDWLWGGTLEEIHTTISHGIRNTTDPEARYSEMPKFGADGLLDKTQIGQVVEYVLMLAGQEHDMDLATPGMQVFADNCAACHGETGLGDRAQGAPNLADAIWLYGGSREAITETVTNARFGVMPAWADKLSQDELKAVAFWVHAKGGGE